MHGINGPKGKRTPAEDANKAAKEEIKQRSGMVAVHIVAGLGTIGEQNPGEANFILHKLGLAVDEDAVIVSAVLTNQSGIRQQPCIHFCAALVIDVDEQSVQTDRTCCQQQEDREARIAARQTKYKRDSENTGYYEQW